MYWGRENMKNQIFPVRNEIDWKIKAEESLKGKTIQSLQTTTYEDITLKPLYSREDEKHVPDYPGGSDFRRGNDSLGYISKKWKIAQQITYKTSLELKEKLEKAIGRGQTALSFELTDALFEEDSTFLEVIRNDDWKYPVAIDAKEFHSKTLSFFSHLSDEECQKVSGYVASDPISTFVVNGFIPQDLEEYFSDWVEFLIEADQKVPHLQTILINTTTYHNGGANAVQELAIAAATGVFYLQQLLENGVDLKKALSKLVFQFSIGSNFFMEIAKLRAARILWSKIAEVYGAEMEWRGMQIAAQTSSFTKTVQDPHVNLLRASNEAFAAVIGGIQYLHITPFDEISGYSNLSERIAQNTQLILQEEVSLQKVIDPSGGSWFIEDLTTELAENAWALFKQIDKNGGILKGLKSGWLQNEISAVYEKRQHDIFTRKVSIIGTNVYANLNEQVPECFQIEGAQKEPIIHGEEIKAIPQTRLAQPYENLRKKAKRLTHLTNIEPYVGLICLGSLKQYKARADFIRGFLEAGGIKGVESGPIITKEMVKEFVQDSHTKYFCLCGSNEQYETTGLEILQFMKDEFPDRKIYLAGLPEKELQSKWKSEGIESFIHVKSDCYGMLFAILSEMEALLNDPQQA
jgi:methylmalonyl-CoA mutase